ncbi:hypothetical protein, partial [Pseudomonas sp. K5]|uniref:hypothetical protein n=1 Tax=Pseudomonas sp. K5 TaxID=1156313 RepID=UPI001D013A26
RHPFLDSSNREIVLTIHRTPTFILWILKRIRLPCASRYPSGSFAGCFLINAAGFLITWGAPFFIYCVVSGQSRSTVWLIGAVVVSSALYCWVVATSIRRSTSK